MPTKSNNTGGVGGKRPGAGRKLTVLDIPDTEGSVMPQPDEILSAKQKDGTKLKAAEIYERVWKWLDNLGTTAYIAPEVIEQYAMCRARWLQCEDTRMFLLTIYLSWLLHVFPYSYWVLACYAVLPTYTAFMISVRQASDLPPASFSSQLSGTPLLLAIFFPLSGGLGTFTL